MGPATCTALPTLECYSLPSDAVIALPYVECTLPVQVLGVVTEEEHSQADCKSCILTVQDDEADGRLHAIGRVDSKEGSTIIIVQFYLTAESQAGSAAGLQRSAHASSKVLKAVYPLALYFKRVRGEQRCA